VADAPEVAFVTMGQWGAVYPRIARWLGSGFREIGTPADIVFLGGTRQVRVDGCVRYVNLGIDRARWALPGLRSYLHKLQPSVTFATPGAMGSVALLAAWLDGLPVVPWEATVAKLDNADIPLYLRQLRLASPSLYRRAARVAAVSSGVRDALVHELAGCVPPERIVTIPNPVDSEEIRRLARPPAERTSEVRLVSVGRLVSAKGFDVLIEACRLARLGPDWELLIIGEGPLRRDLAELVARQGLQAQVTFLGLLENPYPIMASADIAIQPSRWEGFGMAIAEALALGVPLIASDCPGGVSQTLEGGKFGMLVPVEDPPKLAEAITLLAGDAGLRKTLAARGPVRAADFTPASVATRVSALASEIRRERCSAPLLGPT